MTQIATVEKILPGGFVEISVPRKSACGHDCEECAGCGMTGAAIHARSRNDVGAQKGDKVVVDGKAMTEEEYIIKQGGTPLKSNLIRRLVRNVLGVYRTQTKEPMCVARDRDEQTLGETMSTILQYNWQLNDMQEINARSYEDFLIGGLVVHKKTFGWRNGKCDCWTDYVNPDNFFVDNRVTDFRSWDTQVIGEIHD